MAGCSQSKHCAEYCTGHIAVLHRSETLLCAEDMGLPVSRAAGCPMSIQGLNRDMFDARLQSFDETADPTQGRTRVAALRSELGQRGLDGFIVPRADEHQNEYVPKGAERLAWLTGFSGSAGTAVVLSDRAAIFVDGRYTVQVQEQVDTAVFDPVSSTDTPPERWIEGALPRGAALGYDPWLHTQGQVERLGRAVAAAGGRLVAVDGNPIDAIWQDRPEPPIGPVVLHPDSAAGEDRQGKIASVQALLGSVDGLLVSDAHAVAWLLNIRGADVSYTPLPLSFVVLPRGGRPTLFIDARKLSNSVRDALSDHVDIAEPSSLMQALQSLGRSGATLRFDGATAPSRLVEMLRAEGGVADVGTDPIALLKATKNAAEQAGSRRAHSRDAVAFVRFLHWFEREAPKGDLTEIDAVAALETFRRDTGRLKDLSFPTIAGFGPHAALPHYRVTSGSNLRIGSGIFLIDSGAQYEDGTTDITRTLVVGEPDAEMRRCFTLVLKGHIAVARAVFPYGTSGAQIDPFAREALWRAGLDFDHGTGHGVGSYLSVHEGPQRLSKLGTTPLAAGMMLSNEPGYYRAGHWGIRIENLILVEERAVPGGERATLGFETLTFAPIERRLIEPALLTPDEMAWLDQYHADVLAKVGPLLDPEVAAWLEASTRPLRAD